MLTFYMCQAEFTLPPDALSHHPMAAAVLSLSDNGVLQEAVTKGIVVVLIPSVLMS